MKLGLLIDYRMKHLSIDMEPILEAERLGFDSVWLSEAWGADVVAPGSWILSQTSKIKFGTAIMQIPARAPACAAMTTMTLDQLSGGRFILGLGPSGPQVSEGWYGQAFGKPIEKTKEYISIIRQILAREQPAVHEGAHYQLPYQGPGASGLGKPLKSILHGRADQTIYSASFTPGGLRAAAEVADGVIPVWMNPDRFDLLEQDLNKGFAKTGGSRSLDNFDVCPFVFAAVGDDLDKCRLPIKQMLALYIGGMGARNKNFYNDYAKRLGYEEAAVNIQNLYLGGKQAEAVMAVPDQLVDDLNLVGPPERIRERLQAWKKAASARQVDTMIVNCADSTTMRVLAQECL